jgi:hypothetical protein
MKRKIMQRTQRELDAASPDLDKNWTPNMPNNWIGSNFDASIPKRGCVRHLSLNVRTMSHSESGLQDQAQLWTRCYDLETGIVALSDTSLMDNTANELRNSLFRSTQIARQRWHSSNLTVTHGQGRPGVMRETVGGTVLATNDYVSSMLGSALTDSRNAGRWTGRKLIGANNQSIYFYEVYLPTFADKSHPGSAWQTQKGNKSNFN